ncbi:MULTISPECIES: SulP family inorganic anion transporter [Nocardiaceae]|uniref:SulP family inorganic anion transporter n=1 Tax=Nocardiaceae TaxID=85025 RepID=UPI000523016C|nr:carbonic anhydrase [Rhodococcus sp. 06-156-3C]OZD19220.1 carbonic anhydrase [Rhodococcus sp. 06-156-4C]OZD20733.1 carbonic anhydrase [Rhodococcus sp. 06-156-4a]OZD28909.1 carbonic anhydrase [Rhodococcus sp. 06-156-3b]OZD33466.1 carbonic anhydrase [Rhodococcus sp. 06-156-3]OZD63749.1 carbonic anhydrase [Rhodococcus sp. 06-1059B-a]OZF50130.1 carbonic anhydrase [Rhodococcus sp. 14-2470-1a]OZF58709.1 carbonic anhydrase [Rhodococcus sp. 06-156-4]
MTTTVDKDSSDSESSTKGSESPSRIGSILKFDVPASLVVFLVAVPLSIGIAVASGAPVMAGLIAAVIGGILAGALGGSPLQVSGPAAGLTVVVAELVNQFGWAVTCLITVGAGAVQILLGLSRIARHALAISPVVVHAMLAGIGVTIALQQIHVLLGGESESSAVENLLAIPTSVADGQWPSILVGGVVIALMLLWPRLPGAVSKVPGALVAVVAATALSVVLDLNVERIDLPGNLIEALSLPALPEGQWAGVATGVLTIALIASVESLLSAVAVDKMHTGPRTNFDRELLGQGAANMVSGAAGGLPVTGVIVRSSTNVKAGAKSRASAILHGLWILVFSVLFISVVELVPFAALAGLLVMIGVQLIKLADIRIARKTGDIAVYAVTVLGVVALNLLEGVLIGLALAIFLVLRRVVWAHVHADETVDGSWRVHMQGSLSFLSLPRLTHVLSSVPSGSKVNMELAVDFLDHAVHEHLHEWVRQHELGGGTVQIEENGSASLAAAAEAPPKRGLASVRGSLAPWSAWQLKEDSAVDDNPPALRPVLSGVAEYHRTHAEAIKPHLQGLTEFQDPDTFFLCCVDSRVMPNTITSSGPGDLFTVRNMGNMIPAQGQDTSVEASLAYGVDVLGTSSVVVCGHSGCGAMKAVLAGPDKAGDERVVEWLEHGLASLEAYRSGHPVGRAAAELGFSEGDQLAMVNVAVQLQTLTRHRVVGRASAEGKLRVTGLFFDIPTARVLQISTKDITVLDTAEIQPA